MKISMTQYAVGQGGLFGGEVSLEAAGLRWVYDCGSNQRDALLREIGILAAGGEIDLLFISHLDSDHISGIDDLLAQVNVREVVLPYLNQTMLLAAVASDASRGNLNGLFIEAASDLAGWFGSRGVETLTFVDGRREDDEGGEPTLPEEPLLSPGFAGEVDKKWTLSPMPVLDPGFEGAEWTDRADMRSVGYGAAIAIFGGQKVFNWALIPYVQMPSDKQWRNFKAELEDVFGSPLEISEILAQAKRVDVREKLRKCYDALWLNHNLITMTLYSGPLVKARAKSYKGGFRRRVRLSDELVGWMLTGDAHLARLRRRQLFLRYYDQVKSHVGIFMLPHHGSALNHSNLILKEMPNIEIAYAAAGLNSYGHPHRNVIHDVGANGSAHFHRVSEKPFSRIVITQQL